MRYGAGACGRQHAEAGEPLRRGRNPQPLLVGRGDRHRRRGAQLGLEPEAPERGCAVAIREEHRIVGRVRRQQAGLQRGSQLKSPLVLAGPELARRRARREPQESERQQEGVPSLAIAYPLDASGALPMPGRISCGASPGRDLVARDPAVDERDHADGVRDDARIVRREDERHPVPIAQVAHQVHEHLGVLAVEVGGRLVGEHELRPRGHGARHGHALLLAAGQLGWAAGRRARRGPAPRAPRPPARAARGPCPAARARTRRSRAPSAPAPGCTPGTRTRASAGAAAARCVLRRASPIFLPSTTSSPAVGTSSAPSRLSSVVLPLPDGPTSARNSPFATSRSTPRSARTSWPPSGTIFVEAARDDDRSVDHCATRSASAGSVRAANQAG